MYQQPLLAGHESLVNSNDSELLYRSEYAHRVILVTFNDASINRPRISTPFNKYRQRGAYQTSGWQQHISAELADDYQLTPISGWPISELGVYCAVFLISHDTQIEHVLQQLTADKRVDLAQRMLFYQTQSHYSDPYFKLQSHIQQMQIAELHQYSTGKNIKIALIDTGVDLNHPDLKQQISDSHNFAEAISSSFSEDIHGTALAGVMVASADNATGIVGIAPDANLIVLKACWPLSNDSIQATCNSFTLALAINNAIKRGANILNLSLSGEHDPLIEKLLTTALDKHIAIIAATNNTNTEHQFPGSMPGVIAVSQTEPGMNKQTDQTGQQTILAPGEEILTTMPNAGYDFISGSSLSAAHVSAISALLIEHQPQIRPNQIKHLLQTTGINELISIFQNNRINTTRRISGNADLNHVIDKGGNNENSIFFNLTQL